MLYPPTSACSRSDRPLLLPCRATNLAFICPFVGIAGCASWMRLDGLPYKHAGAAARLADAPGLGGNIVYGRHALVNHAASIQFTADELFNLYGTMEIGRASCRGNG